MTSRPASPGVNTLMVACQQGQEPEVNRILSIKPELSLLRDRTGKSALHYCAENSHLGCAQSLVQNAEALLDSQDDEGYTPLHLAVISGNQKMVKFLLCNGADPNCVDSEKHSCVHWATVCGELRCLELLLRSGANPSTPDIHGAFPVHYAAQMCGPNSEMGTDVRLGLAVLRTLLEKGVNVDCRDKDGRQPLLWAASTETRASKTYCPSGSSDAILALVNAGASVCSVDKDGLTALHCAASRGHSECLDTLVTLCGAEVDFMDNNGCTALFYSVTLGHADCTTLLLKHGAEANRQDRKGRAPAHCGAAKGQLETLKILGQYGANLWMRNVRGDLPLHEAVQSGRRDLVRWLLGQLPAAVNAGNSNGRASLHIAAINNNVEMCRILMDLGAGINPLMRNSKNQLMSPLDAALNRGNHGCAKYLQLHGALPASKLLEKHGINRTLLAAHVETRSKMPNVETKVRLDVADHRDFGAQTELDPHPKGSRVVRADVHATQEAEGQPREVVEVIRREYDRSLSLGTERPSNTQLMDQQGKESTRATSTDGPRTSESSKKLRSPKMLKDRSQQTSLDQKSSEEEERGKEEKDSSLKETISDANNSDEVVPKSSETENSASPNRLRHTLGSHRGRASKPPSRVSRNSLRSRERRPLAHSPNDAQSKVNVIRLRDSSSHTFNGTEVLTIAVGDQEVVPGIKSAEFESSVAENTISPNSSLRSTDSTRTGQKDSGFSDYIDLMANADASSEGSTEDEMEHHPWSHKADSALEYKRRRRLRRRAAIPEEAEVPSTTGNMVADFKSAAPRVAERLQNLTTVKAKVDSGMFSRYGNRSNSTVPRENPKVIRIVRPASEANKFVNPDTIAQEVQQSLRKYELERLLFQELQDLKRLQIRSGRANETFMVKRLVDKFRKDHLAPGMRDYDGQFSYRNFERYLYDQLRQLSSSNHGKIPKLKYAEEPPPLRPALPGSPRRDASQCVIRSYQCHHATEAYARYPGSVFQKRPVHKLPALEIAKLQSSADSILEEPAATSRSVLPSLSAQESVIPKKTQPVKGALTTRTSRMLESKIPIREDLIETKRRLRKHASIPKLRSQKVVDSVTSKVAGTIEELPVNGLLSSSIMHKKRLLNHNPLSEIHKDGDDPKINNNNEKFKTIGPFDKYNLSLDYQKIFPNYDLEILETLATLVYKAAEYFDKRSSSNAQGQPFDQSNNALHLSRYMNNERSLKLFPDTVRTLTVNPEETPQNEQIEADKNSLKDKNVVESNKICESTVTNDTMAGEDSTELGAPISVVKKRESIEMDNHNDNENREIIELIVNEKPVEAIISNPLETEVANTKADEKTIGNAENQTDNSKLELHSRNILSHLSKSVDVQTETGKSESEKNTCSIQNSDTITCESEILTVDVMTEEMNAVNKLENPSNKRGNKIKKEHSISEQHSQIPEETNETRDNKGLKNIQTYETRVQETNLAPNRILTDDKIRSKGENEELRNNIELKKLEAHGTRDEETKLTPNRFLSDGKVISSIGKPHSAFSKNRSQKFVASSSSTYINVNNNNLKPKTAYTVSNRNIKTSSGTDTFKTIAPNSLKNSFPESSFKKVIFFNVKPETNPGFHVPTNRLNAGNIKSTLSKTSNSLDNPNIEARKTTANENRSLLMDHLSLDELSSQNTTSPATSGIDTDKKLREANSETGKKIIEIEKTAALKNDFVFGKNSIDNVNLTEDSSEQHKDKQIVQPPMETLREIILRDAENQTLCTFDTTENDSNHPTMNSTLDELRADLGLQPSSTTELSPDEVSSKAFPVSVLEAVRANLRDEEPSPTDKVTVEVSTDKSKVSQTLTFQELLEATKESKEESVLDGLTFEVRRGKDKNVFRLPEDKLRGDRKWQVTFIIDKGRKIPTAATAKM